MSQVVKVQKADSSNIKDLIQLIEKLAHFENLTPPDDRAKRRLENDALSEDPPYEALIAYVDNRPVGYITYFYTYSTFIGKTTLFLEDIFVLDEVRKKGVGRDLFKLCLKEAKKKGCARMDWTVLTWNQNAIDFYEKMGGKRLDWYFYRIVEEDFEAALSL